MVQIRQQFVSFKKRMDRIEAAVYCNSSEEQRAAALDHLNEHIGEVETISGVDTLRW